MVRGELGAATPKARWGEYAGDTGREVRELLLVPREIAHRHLRLASNETTGQASRELGRHSEHGPVHGQIFNLGKMRQGQGTSSRR